MRNIFLFAFIICMIGACASSDTNEPPFELTLQLQENAGKVPPLVSASMGGNYIFEVEFPGEPDTLPEDLQNGEIVRGIMDMFQYVSQGYEQGFLDQEVYDRTRARSDSASLTDEWTDVIISIAVGENSEGDVVVYVEGPDGEFLPEPFPFEPDEIDIMGRVFEVMEANIPVAFEYFNGSEIVAYESSASLFYVQGMPPTENMALVFDKLRMGTWTVNDQTFDVVLAKEGAPPYRKEAYTFLYVDMNRDGVFDVMEDGMEAYKVTEPFNIAGESWMITDISADGSSISIDVSEEKVDPKVALRPGTEAPDFTATTIAGDEFTLSDQRGKYVLIDFWGTWCGPCIETLPQLKETYEVYKGEDFEVIGIAKEASLERFESFVEEENISWPQIAELISGEEAIQELYSVNAYPTYYLIDPEGKIVEYGMSLSGDKLGETLSKYLN